MYQSIQKCVSFSYKYKKHWTSPVQVRSIQDRRRLIKERLRMTALEKYVAIIFPDLPIGVGLDRVLWTFADTVDTFAVYAVQLSPLIVPCFIALTLLTAKCLGFIAAMLIGCLATSSLFWAESTVRERSVLTPPQGSLKMIKVGKNAVVCSLKRLLCHLVP